METFDQNRRAGANGSSLLYKGFLHIPVGFRLELAIGRSPRIRVVDKRYTVADEYIIFNRHTFAYKRVARDLAVVADKGILLDFHEGADLYIVADRTAV